MDKIGLDKLVIYIKYEGDEALMSERWADKNDQNKISFEEFGILASIEDNLVMLRTNKCSKEFAQKLEEGLEQTKRRVTEEVFAYLEKNDKPRYRTK